MLLADERVPIRAASETTLAAQRSAEATRWALCLLIALFVVLQITHAWVVDDAYITLRTVDNFVHGLGLRWNPDERVQSYTHPLWMFALSAVYAVTRESFYSTLALSFACSMGAIVVVLRSHARERNHARSILFLAVLLGSKAFLDYSSSGLENPLTHLLLALFFTRWFDDAPAGQPRTERTLMFGLASLAFVNRMDTIVFFAPACALLVWRSESRLQTLWREALPAALPAIAWVLFSLFYYGAMVPNTAIAKLAGPRVTFGECIQAGLIYLADSAMNDPLTLASCGIAITLGFQARQPRTVAAAAGVLLYLLYVVCAGAIGTHMSGRFFSGCLFLSALILAYEARQPVLAAGACLLTAIWMVASPVSPLHVGFSSYGVPNAERGRGVIIDTRSFVLNEGSALLNSVPGESMPRHPWYLAGRDFRKTGPRVQLGGLLEPLAIGYCGFSAGPEHHFIDILGLADPLIARLPLPKQGEFRPGHFFRTMPDGYVASIENRKNLIADKDLKQYYEPLRLITRGNLWSSERLQAILKLNLGEYDDYLDAYAERNSLRTN